MLSSSQLTALVVALASLAPFGSLLPSGSTCVGIGNIWTCLGEPTSKVSSLDISHSGSTQCSCSCDGSTPLSTECLNTSSLSTVQVISQTGLRPLTVVGLVLFIEVCIALSFWVLLHRARSRTGLLAINDIPTRQTGTSPIQGRSDLVARARAAQSAAGVKILDIDTRPPARR